MNFNDAEGRSPHELDSDLVLILHRLFEKIEVEAVSCGSEVALGSVLFLRVYCANSERRDAEGRSWSSLELLQKEVAEMSWTPEGPRFQSGF